MPSLWEAHLKIMIKYLTVFCFPQVKWKQKKNEKGNFPLFTRLLFRWPSSWSMKFQVSCYTLGPMFCVKVGSLEFCWFLNTKMSSTSWLWKMVAMEIYNQTLLSSQSEMTARGEVFVLFPLMLFTLDYCLVSIWDNQSIFFLFFMLSQCLRISVRR